MLTDLRFAFRMLRKNPGFTAVALMTMALGIGANAAIFTVVESVLLRPLLYPDPHRIVRIVRSYHVEYGPAVTATKFLFWKEHNRALESLAAHDVLGAGYNLNTGGIPERVKGTRVSEGFFRVLGVALVLGRSFTAAETQPGGPAVAIISDALWRSRFAADPSILGRSIRLNNVNHIVVGVMPRGFQFTSAADVWTPLVLTSASDDRANDYFVIGRIRRDQTVQSAQADADTVFSAFKRANPQLVAESSLLALAGGVLGLMVAVWGVPGLSEPQPRIAAQASRGSLGPARRRIRSDHFALNRNPHGLSPRTSCIAR